MDLLSFITLLSYIALNVDIALQLKRIYQTKSSNDLSILGLGIRYAAIIIIMVKFATLKDIALVVGQGLIVVTFTAYFVLAIIYSLRKKS